MSEDTRPSYVHDTVEIEPNVVIGEGTRIWRRAHVRSGARVGRDCNIGANVFIDADVAIGDRVKVREQCFAVRGSRP